MGTRSRTRLHQPFKIGAILCACVLVLLPARAYSKSPDLALLKAGYIINFSRLVTWPNESSVDDLRLCALGRDEELLNRLEGYAGEIVKHRKVRVERYHERQDLSRCEVLFISRSEISVFRGVVEKLSAQPVLTISDIPGFIHAGGMLELELKDDQLGFLANPSCARQARLSISAELLALANNRLEASKIGCR